MGSNRRRQRSDLHRRLFAAATHHPLHAPESARFDRQAGDGRSSILRHLDQLAVAQSSGQLQSGNGEADCGSAGLRSAARCRGDEPRADRCSRRGIRAGRGSTVGGDCSSCRGLPRLIHAKRGSLPIIHVITSLAFAQTKTHLRCGFNAAKGGDPMSHGSAGRSERGVRRP